MASETKKRPLGEVDTNIATYPKKAKHGTTDFSQMAMKELKAELKSRSMKVSGSKPELIERLQQADNARDSLPKGGKTSKFRNKAVTKLKKELQDRDLKTSGNKDELVDRLEQSDHGAEREKAPGFSHPRQDEVEVEIRNQHSREYKEEETTHNTLFPKNESKTEDRQGGSKYSNMNPSDLKKELRGRNLKLGGSKDKLVERLEQSDRDRALEVEKEKIFQEEVRRDEADPSFEPPKVSPSTEYKSALRDELQQNLKARGLKITGSRAELIDRLREADLHSSLIFKRAVETDARKRRERFAADLKKRAETEDFDAQFNRHWRKIEEVKRRGPHARILYDDYGYALSYEQITGGKATQSNKPAWYKNGDQHFAKLKGENRKKAAIMGLNWDGVKNEVTSTQMDWVVSRDLEIPMHMIEWCDFEEWGKRGFKVNRDELSGDAWDKTIDLRVGSAFRMYYR